MLQNYSLNQTGLVIHKTCKKSCPVTFNFKNLILKTIIDSDKQFIDSDLSYHLETNFGADVT